MSCTTCLLLLTLIGAQLLSTPTSAAPREIKVEEEVVGSVTVLAPEAEPTSFITLLSDKEGITAAVHVKAEKLVAAGAAVATVTRSQRLDVPETAPVFSSNPVTSGSLDGPYSYDVNSTANPEATYSLVTAPTGMTIDPATGLISWQPVEGQVGLHAVTVRAENRVLHDDVHFDSRSVTASAL